MLRSGRRVRDVQLTTDELAMRDAQRDAQEEVKRRKLQNERAHRRHQQAQARDDFPSAIILFSHNLRNVCFVSGPSACFQDLKSVI